jgi:hypothetical protein
MNVAQTATELGDFIGDAARLAVMTASVAYADGSNLECFVVAPLGKPEETVVSTKRFVDLCRIARISALEGEEIADLHRRAIGFEEPSGPYIIPARDAITAERIHHDVVEALKEELSGKNIDDHTNEKIGLLGPDLYTTGRYAGLLFEIKTGHDTDNILKAVGQLVVYEQLMPNPCRKIMVLPKGVRDVNRKLIEKIGIEIVEFNRNGKTIKFDWPEGFLGV